MKNKFLKVIFFIIVITGIFLAAVFDTFSSISRGIFVSETSQNTSAIKQFSDMIINPSQALEGEEEGQVNILLLGIGGDGHSGGTLTDTIMILSLKPLTHEAAILSIPRDLYIEIEGTNIGGKINSIQEQGDNSPQKNGNELLKQVIEDISGFHIHYTVQLDFEGFTQAVDSLGGIDIYLENDINDPTYPNFSKGYDPFYIEKGWHHLDGATALKVARSRHSTMGDFDRIKRQQEIIKAFRQKVYERYEKVDAVAFGNIFLSLSQHLKTDFQLKELPRLYYIVKEIKNNNFTVETVDTKNYLDRINIGLGYTLGISEASLEESQKLSDTIFEADITEEEKEEILKEGALIEIQNATNSLDTANKIAHDLEEMGLRIIKTSNINNTGITGTQIEHFKDKEKENTLNFLINAFDAREDVLEEKISEADFIIILGKGF